MASSALAQYLAQNGMSMPETAQAPGGANPMGTPSGQGSMAPQSTPSTYSQDTAAGGGSLADMLGLGDRKTEDEYGGYS